jgi:predicted  nucleic acid-binding Zn-ribbon protein
MSYSFNKLATIAECDMLLDRANLEKEELVHDASGYKLDTTATARSVAQAQADLTSVNVQITAFTAALEALPDGDEKTKMASRIRRLNDRKENLEERVSNTGNTGLLLIEMRKGLADKQVEALNSFIAGVEARKAALAEEEEG